MNYTIFYSWQSDLESKFNRSFIEDAMEKAVKNINKYDTFSLEAIIDRDTYGLSGSPSIIESITAKIAKSDIFVCDVSIINSVSGGRPCPNPNVLYELGFASAILGWDRIIMVQNVSFGSVEQLPFDLRGRRILQYKVDETQEEKASEKLQLKQSLVDTFTEIFKHYSNIALDTKEKIVWWGNWKLQTKIKLHGGEIHITRVSSDGFFFVVSIYDGARSGVVGGRAYILTPHSAYARVKTILDEDCEIHFRRRLNGNTWFIDLDLGSACQSFAGANTSFAGTYYHVAESVLNAGYLDELDLNEIQRLTGVYLSSFLDNFQRITIKYTNSDEGNTLKIISGCVKGLATSMESIIVLDDQGSIWCAFLDEDSKAIRYFTNAYVDTRPKPIKDWLTNFSSWSLIENDDGNQSQL